MSRPISSAKRDSNQTGVVLIDRDQSILAFNERVLDWAKRPEVPLLERLRYLCIVSSNLDEFFEVRADLHMSAFRSDESKGPYRKDTFESVYEHARQVVNEQYRLYNDVLLPKLQKQDIRILSHGERTPAQRQWVSEYFQREVRPLLVPVGLDPAHPFLRLLISLSISLCSYRAKTLLVRQTTSPLSRCLACCHVSFFCPARSRVKLSLWFCCPA